MYHLLGLSRLVSRFLERKEGEEEDEEEESEEDLFIFLRNFLYVSWDEGGVLVSFLEVSEKSDFGSRWRGEDGGRPWPRLPGGRSSLSGQNGGGRLVFCR